MNATTMSYELTIDSQKFTLTTEHATSSHGIPVLVGEDGVAMGPADTCRLLVESASDEAITSLLSAGFDFDDVR